MRDELALTTTLFQDKEKQIAKLMQELEGQQSTRLRESASSSVTIHKIEEERDKIKREHALCAAEVRPPCAIVVECTYTNLHAQIYIHTKVCRQAQPHKCTHRRALVHAHKYTMHSTQYTFACMLT